MMNLQALYDLKERLEYAAIAGTGLLHEDFRLRRAVEALAPLAKASPVFAKIASGANALLTAPEEKRGDALLDVLSLVDAVVYTQGVTGISGELVEAEPGAGKYVPIPYGTLQPLLTALNGTGSGRTAVIREAWENHPAYFEDFRVLPGVVGALRENYDELEELIREILMKQGESIVPLLKEGFDPAGKSEMVRRVRLVVRLCGPAENEWYLAMLPEAKKDVRVALIEALGLTQWNTQILLDLCRTEKGKAKEAALRSLAQMEAAEAAEFWEAEVKKKPDSVFCLSGVCSRIAADLAAVAFRVLIRQILDGSDKVDCGKLQKVLDTVSGNFSPALAEVWRLAAQHMDEIHDRSILWEGTLSGAELLTQTMMETVLLHQTPAVFSLADELAEQNRKWFLCCAVEADLLRLSPAEHFEKYSPFVVPNENEEQRNDRLQILNGMGKAAWNRGSRQFELNLTKDSEVYRHPISGFDNRWLELLTGPDISWQGQILYSRADVPRQELAFWLMRLICPEDGENCRIIGSWLYLKLKVTGALQPYAAGLIECGWKHWKGVLAHCAARSSQVAYHQYINWLEMLPLSNREKAEELRELDELVSSGRVSVWRGHWPKDRVREFITRLENDENMELF